MDKNAFMFTCDEKSGFSHVKIDEKLKNLLAFNLVDFIWCTQHYHLDGMLQLLSINL